MPKKQKQDPMLSTAQVLQLLQNREEQISPWRVFKIMTEFVSGFEFLKGYNRAVSIYGSARFGFDHSIYQEATKLSYRLAKAGYAVITGGGPGVMEAANKGAYEAGGKSVGINIKLPKEQRINQYVKESEAFEYFFVRRVMLAFASQVYIFFPGGFGTLDELMEMVTLVQTKKIRPIPIILINKEFWSPFLSWIRYDICDKNKAIDRRDLDIFHLVDTADEAYRLIKKLGVFRDAEKKKFSTNGFFK